MFMLLTFLNVLILVINNVETLSAETRNRKPRHSAEEFIRTNGITLIVTTFLYGLLLQRRVYTLGPTLNQVNFLIHKNLEI